ncbi:MAG: hypothetical protein ACI9VR_004846 [Cognaticolwellia sp.]|jgi:hypothetical protein
MRFQYTRLFAPMTTTSSSSAVMRIKLSVLSQPRRLVVLPSLFSQWGRPPSNSSQPPVVD